METKKHISHTKKAETIIDYHPGSNSPEESEKKTRFYGLIPLILFSIGLIVVLIILKILLDIILPT